MPEAYPDNPTARKIFVGDHLRLVRLVALHGPVRDVDPVGEEVGHGAAAKIPEPAPVVEFLFAEGLIGCAAKPGLPIKRLLVDRLRRGSLADNSATSRFEPATTRPRLPP